MENREHYLADTGGIVRMHMEELLDEIARLKEIIRLGAKVENNYQMRLWIKRAQKEK